MNYAAAARWLETFANVEQRLDPRQWAGIKLERVERLMALLGHPERHGRVIHIAGSKGKGSVAAMVESVLSAAGYSTGLYTSPHLVTPRERVRLAGQPLAEAEVARLIEARVRPAAEAYQSEPRHGPLTFFDLHTALAFCAFQEAGVEWTILEVGLGGRLDATNVCRPEICAVTRLTLEHTTLLGDTLAKIAGEKAGIFKPGVPVVTAPQEPEAATVLAARATALGCRLHPATGVSGLDPWLDDGERVGQTARIGWSGDKAEVLLPLLGEHQLENAAVARTILELLAADHGRLTLAAVTAGLATVRWPGRLEVVGRRPWVVLDGAHTPLAAERLAAALAHFPHRRRCLIVACAADKSIPEVLQAVGRGADRLLVCGVPGNPRAATPEALLTAAGAVDLTATALPDAAAAMATARAWATPDDLIVLTGSLYLVGDALRTLGREA